MQFNCIMIIYPFSDSYLEEVRDRGQINIIRALSLSFQLEKLHIGKSGRWNIPVYRKPRNICRIVITNKSEVRMVTFRFIGSTETFILTLSSTSYIDKSFSPKTYQRRMT